MRKSALLTLLALGLFLGLALAGCADRGVEIKPSGQMIIGGSVGGSTR